VCLGESPVGYFTFMPPAERVVVAVRPRTVLMVAGLLLAIAAGVWLVLVAERVLIWTLVSLFLAMALNPGVDWLQGHGLRRRGAAVAAVYLAVMATLAGMGALIIPTLVEQISDLIDALPAYVRDLTEGRGPLGFLEREYNVVERVEKAVDGGGDGASLAGGASTALDVTRSVLTFVAGVVTITFMTLFMLLEGPAWKVRLIGLLPPERQEHWEGIAQSVYRTVGGYVTGNLLISFIAGSITTIFLLALGVPYALALGLVVAILDLIPLAGATLAAILVSLIALTESTTTGLVVLGFFIVYQQIENHVLQPVIYGRTVQLSPLAILVSVLIGVEVAGVIGALAAIPLAGTVHILIVDWQRRRRPEVESKAHAATDPPDERDGGAPDPLPPPRGRRRLPTA
jgi:predicted PurR-regulated permease PerM